MNKKRFIDAKTLGLLGILVALIIVFQVISGGAFITLNNIRNILQSTTTVSLLAIGSATLLISREIDLSLGGIGTLGGILVAILLTNGMHWIPAVIIGLAVGALFGALNATLVNYLKLPSFIVTIATASIAQGIGAIISNGGQVAVRDAAITTIGGGRIGGYFPVALIISLGLLLVYGIMLKKTAFGRNIYMVGNNPEASRLCGLHPKKVSYTLFINAAVLAVLAGILVAGRLKNANSTLLTGCQFDGITAAILGGVSMGGGTGGMGGALIGILILNCFDNGTTVIGMDSYWQSIASGMLLVIALLADYLLSSRKKSR